ncbi:MAG: EAL domain-containing protein [Burkholderiaceae bacterium]
MPAPQPPLPPSTTQDLLASANLPARLRALLALVMTLLGLTAWGFFAATASLAEASAGDAEALSLAGRQARYAESLARQALDLADHPLNRQAEADLQAGLGKMMADGVRLYELRGVWGGNDDRPDHWTARRERLWAAVQSLQMAHERAEPASTLAPYAGRVTAEAVAFVRGMEQAVDALQALAEERQQRTRRTHAVMVVLLAVGVTAVLWGLGEPLARRIGRHHARLMAQAQQLERLAMVADRTRNAVVITSAQRTLVWANAAFTEVTGYTLEEAQGKRPGDLLHDGSTDPAALAVLNRAMEAGEAVRVEVLQRGKHGHRYWTDLDIQPLRDAQGVLTGYVSVQTDITSQVERREYLDAILRALPAGLMVQDAQGRVVDANLRAEQLLGLPREALVSGDVFSLGRDAVGEDGEPIALDDLPSRRTLCTGLPQHDRLLGVLHPGGQRRWLRVNTQILAGPDGSTQGVISCFLDETDARAQRHLLRLTIDGAGVGTWDWDMLTERVRYNERWAAMLGYQVAELPPDAGAFLDLVHPDDEPVAREALRRHLVDPAVPYRTEFRMRTRGGDWSWVMAAGAVIERQGDGRARRMAGVHLDITSRKRLEQALSDAALTDALTQLPNRAGIQRALARCVARAHQEPGYAFAVLFMDFDRFKLVNDSLGHDAGDELLRQIAQRVKQALRPGDDVALVSELGGLTDPGALGDTAGRLGGDEFVVLLERIARPEDAAVVAQRLLDALAEPYQLAGRAVQSTASIGIVTSDVSSATVESVLRDADTAMYEAKRRGRGLYAVFDPEMHRRIRHAMELESDLRQALERDEFHVVYQPIVDLATRRPLGLEALARWRHPLRGAVSPADFVPLAEETGLIGALGERVLRRACADMARWQRTLGAEGPRRLAVNLSRAQLRPGVLAATVRAALADAGLVPGVLQLEITETLAMQGESALAVLRELRAMGVGLSLDDFGTGYSSLASLDQLPIDTVKIDRAFVAKMVDSSYQMALVQSTVQVADALRLAVVAEGVETEAQARALSTLGCHRAQGFLYGRPMPAADLAAWWREQNDRADRGAATAPDDLHLETG